MTPQQLHIFQGPGWSGQSHEFHLCCLSVLFTWLDLKWHTAFLSKISNIRKSLDIRTWRQHGPHELHKGDTDHANRIALMQYLATQVFGGHEIQYFKSRNLIWLNHGKHAKDTQWNTSSHEWTTPEMQNSDSTLLLNRPFFKTLFFGCAVIPQALYAKESVSRTRHVGYADDKPLRWCVVGPLSSPRLECITITI